MTWKLAFRENTPLFWIELTEYTRGDCIFLSEGKQVSCYVKDSKPYTIPNLVNKLKENNEKLKNYSYDIKKDASLSDILKFFDKTIKLMKERSKLYLATEAANFDEKEYTKKEVEEIAKLRLESKKITLKHWSLIFSVILTEISRKSNVNFFDLRYYRYEEIKNIDKKLPTPIEIKNRKKSWGIICEKGKRRFLTKEEIKKFKENLLNSSKNTLCGMCAFPGKVKGNAKVILTMNNKEKINKLLSKDKLPNILITPMTQPDIVMHLDSVGGIVTDEGGVLCHAGIISREFKIPCVVGTGNATKNIKTGDIVEIDADKGEVRIVKRLKK